MELERDVAFVRLALVTPRHGVEHTLNREYPHIERSNPVLVPREVEQVSYDPLQAMGLEADRVEVPVTRPRIDLHLRHSERIQIPEHRRQRRLQLVRDVG